MCTFATRHANITHGECRNSQLALILNLEDLLATSGRVRDVELHTDTRNSHTNTETGPVNFRPLLCAIHLTQFLAL